MAIAVPELDFNLDAEMSTRRRSLLPSPLRLRPIATTPLPPRQSPTPPITPATAVLVSLQPADQFTPASGQLSIHEYRRNLSRPALDNGITSTPRRTLKRKPKAVNLNSYKTQFAMPPSPPPTPTASLFIPDCRSTSTFMLDQNLTSPEFNRSLTSTPFTCSEYGPSLTIGDASRRALGPYRGESTNNNHRRLPSLRDCLRYIPTRFISHSKSVSESALPVPPKTLRHRGVSFEILNPRQHSDSNMSSPGREHAVLVASNHSPLPRTPGVETPQSVKTPPLPPRSHRRSMSLGAVPRQTPSRALFEDLPTAHSSITSRTANQRRRIPSTSLNAVSPQVSTLDLSTLPRMHQPTSSATDDLPFLENRKENTDSNNPVMTLETKDAVPPQPTEIRTSTLTNQKTRRDNGSQLSRRLVKRRSIATSHIIPKETNRPVLPPVRPVLNTFVNQHQPNLHGARGRIDKPNVISAIINNRASLSPHCSIHDIGYSFDSTTSAPKFHENLHSDGITPTVDQADSEDRDILPQLPRLSADSSKTKKREHVKSKPIMVPSRTEPRISDRIQRMLGRKPKSIPNISLPISAPRLLSRSPGSTSDHFELSKTSSTGDHSHPGKNLLSHTPQLEGLQGADHLLRHELSILGLLSSQPTSIGLSESSDGVGHISASRTGPGGSQSSSSIGLSEYTASSTVLRSRRQLSSILPPETYDPNEPSPFFHANLGIHRPASKRDGVILDADADGGRDQIDLDDLEDDEKDWESVFDSQNFQSFSPRPIFHIESGSSLANFSSYGSLASKGPKGAIPQTSPRRRHVNSHRSNRSRWANLHHSQDFDPRISFSPQHTHSNSTPNEITHDNKLGDGIPALKASTNINPAPRAASHSLYRHPFPLDESHTNPFLSSPPPLAEKSKGKRANAGRETSGCISAIRSSKFNFQQDIIPNTTPSHAAASKLQSLTNSHHFPHDTSLGSSSWCTEASMSIIPSSSHPHSSPSPFHFHSRSANSTSRPSPLNIPLHNRSAMEAEAIPATDNTSSENLLPLSTPPRSHSREAFAQEDDDRKHEHRALALECDASKTRTGNNISRNSTRRASNGRFPPGSLYLSIISAYDRASVASTRHRRTSTSSTNLTTSDQLLPPPRSETRASSRGEGWFDAIQDHGPDDGRVSGSSGSRLLLSPSAASRPLTRTQRYSRDLRTQRPVKPDDVLRQRLERIETTSTFLSDCTLLGPETRTVSNTRTSQPVRQYAVSRGASSIFASIDADAATLTPTGDHEYWHLSTYGRHVFPEPPRLVPQPHRYNRQQRSHQFDQYYPYYLDQQSRSSTGRQASMTPNLRQGGNLILQRRLGRQLILLFTLALPLGWFVVAFIGFSSMSNCLIRWRSKGLIDQFNRREKHLARQLGVSYAVFSVILALVVLIVCLVST
ncbi:hypothetical protein FQN57_007469 [Myotisia sp. PD_48]|nr:hypothetical protein FQN57_007469 [Myotisia sp. PD_48]